MMKDSKDEASAAKTLASEAKTAVSEMQDDIKQLQQNTVTKAEMQTLVDSAVGQAVNTKMQTMAQRSETETLDNDKPITAVFGGLDSLSFQEAEAWIRRKAKELSVPEPVDSYYKGDDFSGTLFAKFTSAEAARQAIQRFQKNTTKIGNKNVWCKHDRPILERVQVSLLLGLRHQLNLWGSYGKSQLRINEAEFHMTVDHARVVSTTVDNGKITLNWHSTEWDSWTQLKVSVELRALVETANTKLSQSSTTTTKGKADGKRKPANAGQ